MVVFGIVSMVAFILVLGLQKIENRALQIVLFVGGILIVYVGVLSLGSGTMISKSDEGDEFVKNLPYLFLYVAMVAGMISKYFFDELGKKRFYWNFKRMIRPLFISPIVFMIVYQISKESDSIKILHYLLAFQNGFFWQYIFEMYASKFVEEKEMA